MGKILQILILEDYAPDAELAQIELGKVLNNMAVKVVDTERDYVQALKNFKPDLPKPDFARIFYRVQT